MKIEFRIYKNGRVKKTEVTGSCNWGGINSGFFSTDGSIGNICEEKDFEKYKNAIIRRTIKNIDKKILTLEKEKQRYLKLINETNNTTQSKH